ncbi:serine protease [bacterium]|nr:serine protease [bacterium]
MRRTCSTILLATLLANHAAQVHAQGLAAWNRGLGAATAPAANWSPEAFADYVGTGQTPHPAVARIIAPENSGTSMGSGILVDVNRTQGLVLTNWHVIRDSRSGVLVQFPDGFQSAGTVVRWDEPWDLAAIVIWKPNAAPVSLAPEKPAPGEPLTIAGYGRGPFRTETGPCTQYLAPGSGYAMEFVELSATARQGDSGGPIFNTRGELAGVLFGQNDGRTIGSCSTRLRAFLAEVGSSGFQPLPIAEFSDQPAIARSLGTPAGAVPARIAASADADVIQRSTHVVEPQPSPGHVPHQPTLEELLDVQTHGQAMLTTAGGAALAILGLRTMFGGRTKPESHGP